MSLPAVCTDEYWHARHNDCLIDASCRMECVLLAIADDVVPAEPDPGPDATLVAYTAWAQRMRIRRLLLADVH